MLYRTAPHPQVHLKYAFVILQSMRYTSKYIQSILIPYSEVPYHEACLEHVPIQVYFEYTFHAPNMLRSYSDYTFQVPPSIVEVCFEHILSIPEVYLKHTPFMLLLGKGYCQPREQVSSFVCLNKISRYVSMKYAPWMSTSIHHPKIYFHVLLDTMSILGK